MADGSATAREPAVPRLAATIILVREDPFQVLMAERHSETVFASALVFPGGTVSAEDSETAWHPHLDRAEGLPAAERALRIAAVRETWEEAGILLAPGAGACPLPADGQSFRDVVASLGVRLDLGALHKIGHWITPLPAPQRFDTHFYVAAAGADAVAVCDGREIVRTEWMAPDEALRLAAAGVHDVMFPTRMNLKRLADAGSLAAAVANLGGRPPVTVLPTIERTAEGLRAVIPAEAGYGVTEDWQPTRLR